MTPTVREVTLEKVRLGAEALISAHVLDGHVDIVAWLDHHFRAQMRGYLWGKTIQTHEVKYPADWREAVKERFAPAWFLRLWPVRYRTLNFDLKALWPTVRYMVPDHSPRLVLTSFGRALGGYDELPR